MSNCALEQALYDLGNSGKTRKAYTEDPDTFLSRYTLTQGERAMVRDEDVASLFALGLNPMLLMGFYLAFHGPRAMPEYLSKMPTLASRLEA
jgi:protocatechuate 4,5-dioxygenase alpha chain